MSFYLIFLYQECQSGPKCEKSRFFKADVSSRNLGRSFALERTQKVALKNLASRDVRRSVSARNEHHFCGIELFCMKTTFPLVPNIRQLRTWIRIDSPRPSTAGSPDVFCTNHCGFKDVFYTKHCGFRYTSQHFLIKRRIFWIGTRSIGKNPLYKIWEMSGFENETIK